MNPRLQKLRKIAGICLWAVFLAFCAVNRDRLTPEAIAEFTPGNPGLAALTLLLLFALKSVSIFFYSGILYAASGLLFPLPVAVLVNLCGSAVMVTLPYAVGRKAGTPAVNRIEGKYPKLLLLRQVREDNDFLFSFIARAIGILPSDVVSFYMGAIRVRYSTYLAGCLLGMLPQTITFPVMGINLRAPGSPQFLLALLIQILYTLSSVVIYLLVKKRIKVKKERKLP